MKTGRLFRALLRLLPFDFRFDYGREMQSVFEERHREAATAAARVHPPPLAAGARGVRAHRAARAPLAGGPGHAPRAARDGDASRLVRGGAAVFGLVWTAWLKPLPYAEPGRLVAVWNRWNGSPRASLSDPELLDYSDRSRSLRIAAQASGSLNLGGIGEPERLPGAFVTANLLDVLGVAPVLGRGFRTDEETEGNDRVVLLTDALWRRRFASDAGVVGRHVTVNGAPFEVVGVLPAGFRFPNDLRGSRVSAELAVPLTLDRAASRAKRGGHSIQAIARLSPGVTVPAAQREMEGVLAGLVHEYPDEHDQGGFAVWLAPLSEDLAGPTRPVLVILAAAVLLVLAITCANVAGLLLARAEGRRQELAVRSALGADRFRLVRQLLTEAAVLSAGGALLGLGVALVILKGVVVLAPASLPRLDEASLDWPVLAFTMGVAAFAALAFGALPAFQVSRAGVAEVLGEAARGSTSARTGLRRTLVAAQVAIALVLLAGAGLLAKSFARVRAVPSGFESESVLSLRLDAPEARYAGREEVTAFFARVLEDVRSLPGVRSAGAGSGLPMAVSSGDWSFDVEGRPQLGSKHHGAADWYAVTPGYFETLRIRLVRGRLPGTGDVSGAPAVIFLNETAARQFFPGEDAVGRRLRLSRSRGDEQPWREVAGIVGDVRQRGLDQPARAEMYLPHAQFQHFSPGAQARSLSVVARTDVPPLTLAAGVRAAVRRLDPEVPVARLASMDTVVAGSLSERRRDVALIGAFAVLSVVLAAIGLYGLVSTTVAARGREIGLRMALGAERGRVVGMVLGQALRLVGAGAVAGLVLAPLGASLLRDLLFEVSPRDLGVLGGVTVLLLAISAAASLVPALRAARLDPMAALRDE